MSAPTTNPDLVSRMVSEMEQLPPFVIALPPATAFAVVGLLQTALRHPQIAADRFTGREGRAVVAAFRQYLTDAHADACVSVLQMGEQAHPGSVQ